MEPTEEQAAIISETGSCVVMAAPGSGKTFVVAQKIRAIMKQVLPYQGLIAISFTNKASNELKQRSLAGQLEANNSYFGTIDRFCFVEIIAPFGYTVFGHSTKEFEVVAKQDLTEAFTEKLTELAEIKNPFDLPDDHIRFYGELYSQGIILLEHIGICSLLIITRSQACRRYIQAKYSHAFIDEYQDSGLEQHLLFLEMVKMGLTGIAVGDVKQAIYGFAKKDHRHLRALWDNAEFKSYPLTINHRCHPSISNYAKRLFATINPGFDPHYAETQERRVYEKCVNGGEEQLCKWLDLAIPFFAAEFDVPVLKGIGILVSGNGRGELVENLLETSCRFYRTTPLDNEVSLWGTLFKRIMTYIFDPTDSALAVATDFCDVHEAPRVAQTLISKLKELYRSFQVIQDYDELINEGFRKSLLEKFEALAQHVYRGTSNKKAITVLDAVLQNRASLTTFFPPNDGEVQIMTIHKSKGLEFDIVFHLDLLEWVLPRRVYIEGQWDPPVYENITSCTSVHFVGLTRAKEACVLVHMTSRLNKMNERKRGQPSMFLTAHDLQELHTMRQPCPI